MSMSRSRSEHHYYGGNLIQVISDRRYPRVHLTRNLQDAHIYIFKRWIIDLISRNPKFSSIRTDLLPVLAKMQWQSNLRKREGVDEGAHLIDY